MPGEKNLSNQAAEDTVFSNLGLTREELGVEEGSGNEDLDTGSGNERGFDRDEGSGNEGRMTQTSREEPDDSMRPIAPGAEVRADKHGNLLHVGTGRMVAKAGKEARLYQDAHKARGQAQTLQGQLNDVNGRLRRAVEIGQGLHRELESAKSQANAVKQFGLNQNEHLTALRLFTELRDNPEQAIKSILTRAVTNGVNIQNLGLQGGIDSKSLVEMLKQELGQVVQPIKERTDAEKRAAINAQQQNERRTEVMRQVDGFFGQNPEAREYLPVFTETLKQFPDMSLGEIWTRIQLHFAQNPQDRRRNQNSRQRSLPSGRGAPGGGGGSGDLAPVTDSYDAIVRDVMTKAGFTS